MRKLVILVLTLALCCPAYAARDSYSSRDSYGDSYSQSWNDYKWKSNYQDYSRNYKQQGWWQNTVNWVSSLVYKPPAAPVKDQRLETRDQRPLAVEHGLQTIEQSTQTIDQKPRTKDQPAEKFTLPEKLSDCQDQISRKIFLEISPEHNLISQHTQTDNGQATEVYQYQSVSTAKIETVYIRPQDEDKLSQAKQQFFSMGQPIEPAQTQPIKTPDQLPAKNIQLAQNQLLTLPDVTPGAAVQSAHHDPIRQEPAQKWEAAKMMTDEQFLQQAQPTVPKTMPSRDAPIQRKVYLDNSPDYKFTGQTHTPIAPGAGVIYQIFQYANKQTGETEIVSIPTADMPKVEQTQEKIAQSRAPQALKTQTAAQIVKSDLVQLKQAAAAAVEKVKTNPYAAFEIGRTQGAIKAVLTNDYATPQEHPYANARTITDKLTLSRAADKIDFVTAQAVEKDKAKSLESFKNFVGDKTESARILANAYEAYLNVEGFVMQLPVNTITDIGRFGSEMPMMWEDVQGAAKAFQNKDYEACGKYLGDFSVRGFREFGRGYVFAKAAKVGFDALKGAVAGIAGRKPQLSIVATATPVSEGKPPNNPPGGKSTIPLSQRGQYNIGGRKLDLTIKEIAAKNPKGLLTARDLANIQKWEAKIIANGGEAKLSPKSQALIEASYRVVGVGPWGVIPKGIRITQNGPVPTDALLAKQGTSPLVGNFKGLTGKPVEEIISRVPKDWRWAIQNDGHGIKFIDTAGAEKIRLHAPSYNPEIPLGNNARQGWIMRVYDPMFDRRLEASPFHGSTDLKYSGYLDDFGNPSPLRSNESHIPIEGNLNLKNKEI